MKLLKRQTAGNRGAQSKGAKAVRRQAGPAATNFNFQFTVRELEGESKYG